MTDAARTAAAVVVSYGDPTILLANPLLLGAPGWRVVVVDNLSTASHRELVRTLALRHGWDLIEPDRNLGFGLGANAGIDRALVAGSDVVLLVNPDAALEPAAADDLATHARRNPETLTAPRIVRPDGSTWFAGASLDLRTGRTWAHTPPRHVGQVVPWLSGACLVATAQSWRDMGGFAGDYFLYWEDIDLSVRWTRAGGKLAVLGDVACTHTVGGTQRAASDRGKSPLYYYYNCRNRLVFARHHLAPRARWRWALGTLPYARAVLLRGGRRQLLEPGPTIGAALRGTFAGLRILLATGPTRTATPQAQG